MFIFGIVATMIMTLMVTISTTFTRERAASESTSVAAIGMNELTRVIRSGTEIPVFPSGTPNLPVFTEAHSEKVVLHAYIDTDSVNPRPIRVQFEVDPVSRDLMETRWDSYANPSSLGFWLFNSTPTSSKVIARKIIVPSGAEPPLFTYLVIDGAGIPQPLTMPAGGIAASDLSDIAVVEVTMKVQADVTARAEPVTLTNRVGIPNLGIPRLGL